ncbi:MAG: hypothetical protein VXW31_01135, partial [Planctomycetota bacterium]|nr:hypothetical protein [Planctomycetota bacterium]
MPEPENPPGWDEPATDRRDNGTGHGDGDDDDEDAGDDDNADRGQDGQRRHADTDADTPRAPCGCPLSSVAAGYHRIQTCPIGRRLWDNRRRNTTDAPTDPDTNERDHDDPDAPNPDDTRTTPAPARADAASIPRQAWEAMAALDYDGELEYHVPTLREPPRFFRTTLRRAYAVSLRERARTGSAASWALFDLTSRMLLRRTQHQGKRGEAEFHERAARFFAGDWQELLTEARAQAVTRHPRRQLSPEEEARRRRAQACQQVRMGEVSRARQALLAAELAPGTEETLTELTNPELRPAHPAEALPPEVRNDNPPRPLELNRTHLQQALRTARRGTAPGLSGTRAEHLKVLLEDNELLGLFGDAAEVLARAEAPRPVARALAKGRLTALRKPTGKIRGIVTGATVRRIVAKTLAMQYADAIEKTTAPYQLALRTRAGTDALAFALRTATDKDPDAVILSLDGIGAYDHIRRRAMLGKLYDTPELQTLLPFVRQFYGEPSE